jgi:hypothetical protein
MLFNILKAGGLNKKGKILFNDKRKAKFASANLVLLGA